MKGSRDISGRLKRCALFCLLLASFSTRLFGAEIEDRFSRLREEQVQGKIAKADEVASRIDVMRSQLEEERKNALKSQERIWQEYTQSLEVERKKLSEQISTLDERQKLFESELDRKREQDVLRLKEREDEISRMMHEMDRLRSEAVQDQQTFETQAREAQSRTRTVPGEDGSYEVLKNNSIKVANMPARELMGNTRFAPRQVRSEYYIEIGDILDIDVWRVPDLTRSVSVRPDGRISMPVVGDLEVVGLTLTELRELLTEKISEYVWSPQISISIQQFGGRKFIILGEVGGPGVYRFQNDISLVEAIALAGGMKEYAKKGKIAIIRGDVRKSPQVKIISANFANILKQGMLSENLAILPNDIIYVGRDIVGDSRAFLDDVVNPFFDTALDYFVLHSASREDHNS